MGFSAKWIHWMTLCVESVDYFVLVNNNKEGLIISGRGLRQGDPLSLYLFIIGVKGLSSLIRDAEGHEVISGTSICCVAPPISHLLFTNDCSLFFKAGEAQARVMKNVPTMYEAASR